MKLNYNVNFENFNYILLNILITVERFAIFVSRGHLVTSGKNRYYASQKLHLD